MQLLRVEHGRRAALEVGDVAALVGDEERPLELAGVLVVDAEVRRDLHGALRPLGDVAEGAVAEDCAVQARKVVVRRGHDAAKVLLDELRVLLDGLVDGAEDDAGLQELLLEGRADALAVEDGVHGDVGEALLLSERDAQLFERCQNLRIDLVQARLLGLRLWPRVVDNVLEVDRLHVDVGPVRHVHLQEGCERLQPEVQHPVGLALDLPDLSHDVLVQPFRQCL
mmetsp:Transcript_55570/g.146297  ORF Transcript_55570/g.146297 Transcript_55570/m.146297 type:complete len:225 (-) Transcript_55570:529-1203(-)